MKDVAGMIRSFSYAGFSALERLVTEKDGNSQVSERSNLEAWVRSWHSAASTEFLQAYEVAIAASPALLPTPAGSKNLLNAYLLEKALYELLYELNNRPAWLRIPMDGILTL